MSPSCSFVEITKNSNVFVIEHVSLNLLQVCQVTVNHKNIHMGVEIFVAAVLSYFNGT